MGYVAISQSMLAIQGFRQEKVCRGRNKKGQENRKGKYQRRRKSKEKEKKRKKRNEKIRGKRKEQDKREEQKNRISWIKIGEIRLDALQC